MYSEPNLHSRNLKLFSIFFILYWLLGLKPVDDSIRLAVVNYEISNPSALQWVAYSVLFYFAWRFYLNSKHRIGMGCRKSMSIHSFPNKDSRLYKKLEPIAEEHYIKNKKSEFEGGRQSKFEESPVEGFNNKGYQVYVTKLNYESKSLKLDYHVRYDGTSLPGNDFVNGSVFFGRFDFLLFKLVGFCKFSLNQEDAADYLLPWILFMLALVCAVLTKLGVSVNCIGWQGS